MFLNIIKVIYFEIYLWLEFILKNIPGKTGIIIRIFFYSIIKRKFLKIRINNGSVIRNIRSINFQNGVAIGPNCYFDSTGGSISIGERSAFNESCHINASVGGNIIIGKKVIFGPKVLMRTANHKFNIENKYIQDSGHTFDDIVINDNCWIGGNCTILGGVNIGTGSVIGAGAVVTKDIPANSIAIGVPAKVIKKINYD